jgi:hypothetical protein
MSEMSAKEYAGFGQRIAAFLLNGIIQMIAGFVIVYVWALAFVALMLITGCASTDRVVFDATKRAPTTAVDVFRPGEIPKREIKEIGELSFVGLPQDELKALAYFIAEGKKMGSQAIIVETPVPGSVRAGPFGAARLFVFKAKVVIYEQKFD